MKIETALHYAAESARRLESVNGLIPTPDHTLAPVVHQAQVELRTRVSLLCRKPVPLDRLSLVLLHTLTKSEIVAKKRLRPSHALGGQRAGDFCSAA